MDPSEANIVLWIELTSLLQLGLLEAVFAWMTEALWLVWLSWAGADGLGGTAALGGSVGPGWCGRPYLLASVIASVVRLIDPTRSCRVESFGRQCMEPY
jgi:hypothetical protein